MIDHNYKCIFIHGGRTGGTSIESSFGQPIILMREGKHWTQKTMRVKYSEYWKDYYKFSCVRNPYDLLVSIYFHNKQINYEWYEKTLNVDIRQLNFVDFLKVEGADTVLKYLDNLNEIDYIIRFEELQKGFDYVCGQIGKPKRLLERIGSSTHELYMNYYDTREKIELVNEYMKDYFEIYGYEKW